MTIHHDFPFLWELNLGTFFFSRVKYTIWSYEDKNLYVYMSIHIKNKFNVTLCHGLIISVVGPNPE